MKIFTGNQIRDYDRYTMEHEPIRSIDLMERAAREIAVAITRHHNTSCRMVVFAGPGNNGGDALAVARLLAERGYSVEAFLFNVQDKLSEDCDTNRKRLLECKQIKKFVEIKVNFDPPKLDKTTVVIDGLFGSGINKALTGGFAALVKYINQSQAYVISIDLPSGLMTEDNTHNILTNIIRAEQTLTIQQKKLCMFMADNRHFLGKVEVLDIKLSKEYEEKTESNYIQIAESDIYPLMRRRTDFAHKGSMGHALLVAGSYGMSGAAILASRACLRSGVGKLTVCTPRKNYAVMQLATPEAVLAIDHDEFAFSEAVPSEEYDALGIGPGLGRSENTAIAMIAQVRRMQCPVVIDADGLNILATHRAWMQQLPKGIILTPHPGEMDRLLGAPCNNDYERLSKTREMAMRANLYILLKGHFSTLCTPEGQVYINSTGNAGMATAGSGDVLTGIITGLLARGYSRQRACIIGMYLHGLAGDMAAADKGVESLIASDIIDFLPKAFNQLYQQK